MNKPNTLDIIKVNKIVYEMLNCDYEKKFPMQINFNILAIFGGKKKV